jgi:methylmalonyl-CoA mutase N-terminal domain/subunit
MERDNEAVGAALNRVEEAAHNDNENLMPHFIEAVKTYATLGEIVDVLKKVFSTYEEPLWI